MQLRTIFFIMGILLVCIGTTMVFPIGISFYYADGVLQPLLVACGTVLLSGFFLTIICHNDKQRFLSNREGFAVVGFCWIAASIAGALPYIFALNMPFTDAVFETASGFTTTGATIIENVEAIPKSILMWRSLTHWLGGMGIILLSLAILPLLGVGGMQLYKAEVPGPNPDKLTPHIQDTAMLLWKVYLFMTISEIILLYLAGMDLFNAITQSFATVATGGFSTKNNSIAGFPSPFIQWIIIFFMFAAGVNFTLHYKFLLKHPKVYIKDTEFKTYFTLLIIGTLIIIASFTAYHTYTLKTFSQIESAVRTSVFQIISICTTTGFVTTDYSLWPQLAQGVLLFFMFVGGCAGSTSGGLKTMRVIVLSLIAYKEIFRLLHPHSVRFPKIEGKTIPKEVLSGIVGFFLLYLTVLFIGTLSLLAFNYDLVTAFTATLTCLSNVGPGMGEIVGPTETFSQLYPSVKWILTACMLLGRLEIYALFILLIPAFWKY